MNPIKTILAPLASLRLTIGLLLIAMILVLAGTTAQRDLGIQDVQSQFFHAWFSKLYFHYFQSTPAAKPGHLPSEGYWPGYLWFPGGYTLIVAMLANLLAAHSIRFKFRWKRTGIIMIHSGLILLLVGEMMTSLYAVESQMAINVGDTANYARDIRYSELAVIDSSPANHDNVTVISHSKLSAAAGSAPIHDSKLPFDVRIDKWYDNSSVRGPMQTGSDIDRLATAGDLKIYGVVRAPKISGAEAGGGIDMPSAFVTLLRNGTSLGTYFVTTLFDVSGAGQPVVVDGKTYTIGLRFARYYKTYTVHLKQFTHEIYPGTDMAKDFASTIQLVDPTRHVDREVRIWMNHPLRYAGETFYQQSFSPDNKQSTLQIVHNPAWLGPYIACTVGGLGLIVHFSMTLISFLRRKLAPASGTVGAVSGKRPQPVPARNAKRGSTKNTAPLPEADRYTLSPDPMWKTTLIPLAVVGIAITCVVSQFFATSPTTPYDLETLGHVPIYIEGRLQPLDSTARNLLSIVSGGKTTFRDEKGESHAAIEWLADVMTLSHHWADDKVIRIDHPQIKDLLGLKEEEKLFSWNDIKPRDPEVAEKLDRQARLANEVPAKDQDTFQQKIVELHNHLGQYQRLMQVEAIVYFRDVLAHPEKSREVLGGIEQVMKDVDQVVSQANPGLADMAQAGDEKSQIKMNNEIGAALARILPKLPTDLREAMEKWLLLNRLKGMGAEGQLLLIPPSESSKNQWQPIATALQSPDSESVTELLKALKEYADGNAHDFNSNIAAYVARVQSLPGMNTINSEVGLNHVNPFYLSMVMYVTIFVLALFSWLFWTKPMWRTAYGLLVVALIVHTFGLVLRIYISGRPPVTNLYSASVFIGWAIVLFTAVMELIFRNGIGLVAGSTAGFVSLLVAAGFAIGEGDTMKQLQAVLDTNIWLATHVVCVTLGYMASCFAGLLAIIYILRGIFDRSFAGEESKDNSRMIYGIACFAMLFSFVGTILGGIWADQSWGRFWGWDPKENGAVLVVLWNALILHARWSGIVRERGVAVLAVLGNIVVGWSFVGTNLLGIGLHSYGFMSGAQLGLLVWCGINLSLAGLGLLPKHLWAISSESAK